MPRQHAFKFQTKIKNIKNQSTKPLSLEKWSWILIQSRLPLFVRNQIVEPEIILGNETFINVLLFLDPITRLGYYPYPGVWTN